MILHGNQRGGAKDLAMHLLKDENEHVEVHELRGFVSDDLVSALNESYAISKGTQARQFLFSLSLNPPLKENVSTEDFEKDMRQDDIAELLGITPTEASLLLLGHLSRFSLDKLLDFLKKIDKQKGHIGSSFEGFLKEQGALEESAIISMQRLADWLAREV